MNYNNGMMMTNVVPCIYVWVDQTRAHAMPPLTLPMPGLCYLGLVIHCGGRGGASFISSNAARRRPSKMREMREQKLVKDKCQAVCVPKENRTIIGGLKDWTTI